MKRQQIITSIKQAKKSNDAFNERLNLMTKNLPPMDSDEK